MRNVFLLMLVLVANAGAQSRPADYLQQFDLNADGRVQLEEFQSYMIQGFDARDVSGNGVLDINEQPRGARRRPISRDAHMRALEAAFHRQDRNGDGHLDAAELSAPPG